MIKYVLKEQSIDVLDTVFKNRNLDIEQAKKIINSSLDNIESPFLLRNMEYSVEKIIKTMRENKLIVIPIDSDCDGWCSASQLYHYIRYVLNYENVSYIFHDNPKAHGFTDYIVKKLKSLKAGLVIMADGGCGDDDRRKYQTVINNGTEIIILDHHPFQGEYQKEVALVNCHQKGENTNINLSGAGVTYKFLQALAIRLGNLEKTLRYRDLVSLSLVSDLMDLKELENRALLNEGVIESNICSPFIKKIMLKNKIEGYLTIEELGFSVAPLINATVRMGKKSEKEKVFRSLICIGELVESEKRGEKGKGVFVPLEDEAVRIANNLKSAQDKKRDKSIEQLLKVEYDNLKNGKTFIADVGEYMDAEISGLVANKLLGVAKKPIILLRWNNKKLCYTGSARGITESKELPSFKKLCLNTGRFLFCSGHENAFGLGIGLSNDEIDKIKTNLNNQYKERLENGEISKIELENIYSIEIKNKTDNILDQIKIELDKELEGIEFETCYSVDYSYDKTVPMQHIKLISEYEKLWCNNIKIPLFIVSNIRLHTSQIEKFGNATYSFKLGNVNFTKNFGSKVWYENIIQSEILPFGGNIVADIVFKMRKNKQGYYYCEIVDMETREDEDIIDF